MGYQGIEGSHTEEALDKIIRKLGLNNAVKVGLISTAHHCGVVAVNNSIGGVVLETHEAMRGKKCIEICGVSIRINQCLYGKGSIENITKVVSHIQALKQTENSLKILLPDIITEEIEDTALGAKKLSESYYDNSVGVICSKRAGEIYGLNLIKENIEDRVDNITEFVLIKQGE